MISIGTARTAPSPKSVVRIPADLFTLARRNEGPIGERRVQRGLTRNRPGPRRPATPHGPRGTAPARPGRRHRDRSPSSTRSRRGTWVSLALAALTLLGLELASETRSRASAVLFCVLALGGAWHHSRWNDRGRRPGLERHGDAAARLAAGRGRGECSASRTSEGYGPGDPPRVVTRMIVELTEVTDGSRWRAGSGRVIVIVAGDRTDLTGRTTGRGGGPARAGRRAAQPRRVRLPVLPPRPGHPPAALHR